MKIIKKRTIIKRRGSVFFFARSISNWGFKRLTKVHVEFEEDLIPLKNSDGVFLYTGLHKSLWETTGVLSALHHNGLPIPLVGMGDNLIKGKFFVSLAKRTGSLFLVKRGKTRRELVESAQMLNLPAALQFCLDTGATPWLIVGPYFNEEEWQGLIDYLAGDASTDY